MKDRHGHTAASLVSHLNGRRKKKEENGKKEFFTPTWTRTRVIGFRVQGDNRYTMGASVRWFLTHLIIMIMITLGLSEEKGEKEKDGTPTGARTRDLRCVKATS
jgi:hypothetical protein